MIRNVRYIVTKGTPCGTLQVGDKVSLNDDGTLSDYQANGWLDADVADTLIKEIEYEIDEEYYKNKVDKAKTNLKKYIKLIN